MNIVFYWFGEILDFVENWDGWILIRVVVGEILVIVDENL